VAGLPASSPPSEEKSYLIGRAAKTRRKHTAAAIAFITAPKPDPTGARRSRARPPCFRLRDVEAPRTLHLSIGLARIVTGCSGKALRKRKP